MGSRQRDKMVKGNYDINKKWAERPDRWSGRRMGGLMLPDHTDKQSWRFSNRKFTAWIRSWWFYITVMRFGWDLWPSCSWSPPDEGPCCSNQFDAAGLHRGPSTWFLLWHTVWIVGPLCLYKDKQSVEFLSFYGLLWGGGLNRTCHWQVVL